MLNTEAQAHHATGPKTAYGKAISARNATKHGIFCRQTITDLFARRTREDVLEKMGTTDSYCAQNPYKSHQVEGEVLANLHWPLPGEGFTDGLDNVSEALVVEVALESDATEVSAQNPLPELGEGRSLATGVRAVSESEHENCQNEPPSASAILPLTGGGGTACRDGGGTDEYGGEFSATAGDGWEANAPRL
jgi:hypothetical protein